MEQSVIDKNLTVKQGADEMGSTSISDKNQSNWLPTSLSPHPGYPLICKDDGSM